MTRSWSVAFAHVVEELLELPPFRLAVRHDEAVLGERRERLALLRGQRRLRRDARPIEQRRDVARHDQLRVVNVFIRNTSSL